MVQARVAMLTIRLASSTAPPYCSRGQALRAVSQYGLDLGDQAGRGRGFQVPGGGQGRSCCWIVH